MQHVIKDRNMRGDLYQTILKHGFLYYLATCTLNIVTMGFYFSCVPSDFLSEVISLTPPYQSDRSQRTLNGIASWFAWILPSMLSCSLLLALRHAPNVTRLTVVLCRPSLRYFSNANWLVSRIS